MNRVMLPMFVVSSRIVAAVLCAASTWAIAEAALFAKASAQSLAACPAAVADEYLLLVNNPSPEEQNRLTQVIPTGATVVQCEYEGTTVVQVSNFADEELARSWAEYLSTVEGFQTAVVLPPGDSAIPEATPVVDPAISDESPSEATSNDTTNTPTYQPALLEPGYAVLVRYFNRPELAAQLQAQLNTPVGLAVYEQQPYLLAFYSSNAATAGQVLQDLSQKFSAVMIDSRQVVVLSPVVSVAEPTAERGNSQ